MNGSNFRSQLRTNIPGDTRISGRFNTNGATLSVLEGKKYVVDHQGVGLYRVRFGTSTSALTPVKGLIACFATAVIANPAADLRFLVVKTIDTNANGSVAGVTIAALNSLFNLANLAADDDICFECIVRDTEITV